MIHARRTWVFAGDRAPHSRRITTLDDRVGSGRMTRTARRLRERLVSGGYELPDVVHVHRQYPGRNQQSIGAWSWVLVDDRGRGVSRGPGEFGSRFPAVQCATTPRLAFVDDGRYGDVELVPDDE